LRLRLAPGVVLWHRPTRTWPPHRPGGRDRRAGDHGRLPWAVCLPVRRAAGSHGQAGAALRWLWPGGRRTAARLGRAQIHGWPGGQPDRRGEPGATRRVGRPPS